MRALKLTLMALFIVATYNCKDFKKGYEDGVNAAKEEAAAEANTFSLVSDSTKVSFKAYKTTEKLPVGGKFMKINIIESNSGATALDALNGTTFSIPVSSLFTNDATGTRDPKLLEFFFGVMENTELISGVFKVEGEKCAIEVTMNGKTATINLTTQKNSETAYTFDGVMQLEDWDALDAVTSINKACEALHTGPDGVSKTWSDVAVQAEVLLQKAE